MAQFRRSERRSWVLYRVPRLAAACCWSLSFVLALSRACRGGDTDVRACRSRTTSRRASVHDLRRSAGGLALAAWRGRAGALQSGCAALALAVPRQHRLHRYHPHRAGGDSGPVRCCSCSGVARWRGTAGLLAAAAVALVAGMVVSAVAAQQRHGLYDEVQLYRTLHASDAALASGWNSGTSRRLRPRGAGDRPRHRLDHRSVPPGCGRKDWRVGAALRQSAQPDSRWRSSSASSALPCCLRCGSRILLLFRGERLRPGIGLVVVAQNIVGSLFNSQLFDFTQGWVYVIGVGVAAGVVRRIGAKTPPAQ